MKKKHFEAIAEILRESIVELPIYGDVADARRRCKSINQKVRDITQRLSDYFSEINPSFDPVRFREVVEGVCPHQPKSWLEIEGNKCSICEPKESKCEGENCKGNCEFRCKAVEGGCKHTDKFVCVHCREDNKRILDIDDYRDSQE